MSQGQGQGLSTAETVQVVTGPRESPFKTILNYRDVGLTINSLQAKV